MARSGRAKARTKRARAAPKTQTDYPCHNITMQQEARNTEGRNLWRTGLALRHKTVQFVSASAMQPEEEPPLEGKKAEEKHSDIDSANIQEGENTADDDQALLDVLGEGIANTDISALNGRGDTPETTGSHTDYESSEDEIVFHGRNNRTERGSPVREDLRARVIHHPPSLLEVPMDTQPSSTPDRKSAPNKSPPTAPNAFDAPFISFGKPKSSKEIQRHQPDEEYDPLADYIANIDSDYLEDLQTSSPLEEEPHSTRSSSIPIGDDRVPRSSGQDHGRLASGPPSFNKRDYETLEEGIELPTAIEEGDKPDIRNSRTSDGDKSPWSSSEALDDAEAQEDSVDEDSFAQELDDILRELGRNTARSSRNRNRAKGNFFAPATAFADALESDPYYGFDIMDFERPNSRKQRTGKHQTLDFILSDTELEMELQRAWRTDRDKKKIKKQKREELRSQGLLGRRYGDEDLKTKYSTSMSLDDIKKEICDFISSSKNSLPLPPMDKHRRKAVHDLANDLSLNSKSRGKGSSRFPILHKTSRTPKFSQKTAIQVDRVFTKAKFKHGGTKWDQTVSKATKPRRGRPEGAVSYTDGDIVGGSAPEIGAGNKGRVMLEKMGWSTGTALGATNNKGILLPVTHVVKNTKAGLG
ncbi:hypothetical protein FE257_010483 [Aspergillus nanangensis]|uniref:Protein SQS1 n=1 Tax=Aspergillus nanangensis TaxID=2582783 RepID=A0AAD4CJ12_ASPNN|nr:hypothetical protein FE257_010483 [Aspergillus nanangensis]